jgi:hypothetical protein
MPDDDRQPDPTAPQTYLRCLHCRGFYEAERAKCKWCDYATPLLDAAGQPRVFPDRSTCRTIQIAEYDQLPPEAHADPMGPPKDELALLCNCLHCGPEGHVFEAVEMRWMVTERMWACPCTTCGGRGFGIDIHSAENRWQCADCGHFYIPENRDYHPENAKCPKCGCKEANGWFEDDYDEEDFADEALDLPPPGHDEPRPELDEELPWDDDDDGDDDEPASSEYDLGITWKERDDDDDDEFGDDGGFFGFDGHPDRDRRLPDDIDFPHIRDQGNPALDDMPFSGFSPPDRDRRLPDDIDFPHIGDERDTDFGADFDDDDIPF